MQSQQYLLNTKVKQLPVLGFVLGPQVVLEALSPAANLLGR